jgi:hypothetical protein
MCLRWPSAQVGCHVPISWPRVPGGSIRFPQVACIVLGRRRFETLSTDSLKAWKTLGRFFKWGNSNSYDFPNKTTARSGLSSFLRVGVIIIIIIIIIGHIMIQNGHFMVQVTKESSPPFRRSGRANRESIDADYCRA